MNQRILELAEQAELTKGVWAVPDFILEKFAELIVRECASVAFKYAPSDESACDISAKIEEQFGVR